MSDKDAEQNKDYSLAAVRQIANGDDSFIATLIEAFRTEAEEISQDMLNALSNRNIEHINRLAHKIKPTLQQFEMVTLHKQSLELENMNTDTEKEVIRKKVKKFIGGLEDMKAKIEQE